MRGKVDLSHHNILAWWITPAYAGKRHGWVKAKTTTQDHPRVCGEKDDTRGCSAAIPGSPPRMRGKGVVKKQTKKRGRITPAYAGKRFPLLRP